jgi:hypothetical protein
VTGQSLTLVVAEVAHVQSYIFKSNRLKENVGASYLVASATGLWAFEQLQVMNVSHNLTADYNFKDDQHIENGDVTVEVLYSGGGNFVALFANQEHAQDFITRLSRKVLLEAPNLHFVCHHTNFKWNEKGICLSKVVGNALGDLKAQRSQQPIQYGLGGLGISEMCASTQLPAVWLDKLGQDDTLSPVSAEVIAKRQAAELANKRLRDDLLTRNDYDFPNELDNMGRTRDEASQMAVIHADGNGLGRIITDLFSTITDNRTYITLMRGFSQRVKDLARDTQRAMLARLIANVEPDKTGTGREISRHHTVAPITLEKVDGESVKYYLPIRPLISGGDDISFACDARLALALSSHLVEVFEETSAPLMTWLYGAVKDLDEYKALSDKEQTAITPPRLTACAGIAIVNVHYPFSRAYELAEELCKSSKQERKRRDVKAGGLDWFEVTGGIYGELGEMRQRELSVGEDKSLILRPVFYSKYEQPETFRTWEFVRDMAETFQEDWRDHRSKAHNLRLTLRSGEPQATQIYRVRYLTASADKWKQGLPPYLPEHEVYEFHEKGGWLPENEDDEVVYCGYFDALDIIDLYFPLHDEKAVSDAHI